MADPTSAQLDDVTFESGITTGGTVAASSYFTTLKGTSYTFKWDNDAQGVTMASSSAVGTGGGTVTYSFSSSITAAQQASIAATLTLYSDICNVSFKQATNTNSSDVFFETNSGEGTTTTEPNSHPSTVGSSNVSSALSPDGAYNNQCIVSFDTSGSWGQIGSFTDSSGYGIMTMTHEIGHVLGLGHAGNYNDNSPVIQQYNAFDNRQYSVMSYINPDDTSAKYYSANPVSGTSWSVPGNVSATPSTPMMDDILSLQRLYGASKSATFSGGQTFGFNCNISDASEQFYDFTKNPNPVFTIYDTGLNNTLDCSGFSTSCNINLNPGTFSTANNGILVNNIAIAYGTRVDNAIGGSGNDTFIANADGNTINGGGGNNSVIFAGQASDYTVVATGSGNEIVTDVSSGAVSTLTNIQHVEFSGAAQCFTSGTPIAVVRDGVEVDVAVEDLRIGDVAITATGGRRSIRWIGHREIAIATQATARGLWPIRVSAGAFGTGRDGRSVPTQDLRLSAGHPVLVGADRDNHGGALVPLMCLVNGTSIAYQRVERVVYWHVELVSHDVIMAAGLPAESFFESSGREWFAATAPEVVTLVEPDLALPGMRGRCRPVVIDGDEVHRERRRLDALFASRLAGESGWPHPEATETPDRPHCH